MHHDAQTAATVRATCVEMLPAYPAEDFVVVTLRTLTQLAAHALVDIPEQVSGQQHFPVCVTSRPNILRA